MTSLWPQIEPILPRVQKPARYIGCEDGAIVPGPLAGRVGWLLIYPDAYEIGLPNQGLQILYELINERADARAERAYAPWIDMEEQLRRRGLPLFSVDSHRPAVRVRSAGVQSVGGAASTPTSSTAWIWPARQCEPPTAAPSTRSWSRAAIAPSTPSRSRTSSTYS